MSATLAVGAIEFYQRFISPYKGFRCAHRALRGGSSCSHFAKRAARRVGLAGLMPLLQRRFARCAEAARSVKARLTHRRARAGSTMAAASEVHDYEKPRARAEENERSRKDRGAACVDGSSCGNCLPDVGHIGCDLMADGIRSCDGCGLDLTP